MKLALLALAAALAGCAHDPVYVPTPVPCIKEKPVKPAFVTDAELRRMSDYQIPKALWRDRKQRQQYEAEQDVLIDNCATLKGTP